MTPWWYVVQCIREAAPKKAGISSHELTDNELIRSAAMMYLYILIF